MNWDWLWRLFRKMGFMSQQRPLTVGSVRVIGLVAGTHVIEDIGRDVPHGETITISAEQAFRSKDLWRAISQKCLMQMPLIAATPAAMPSYQQPPPAPDTEKPRLEAHIRSLEAQVRTLSAESISLKAEIRRRDEAEGQGHGQKLDEILAALRNGVPMGGQIMPKAAPKNEVADGSAPTFLPSEIKPKDVTVRIDIQGESSESDVSGAAERLRRMRNKGEGQG